MLKLQFCLEVPVPSEPFCDDKKKEKKRLSKWTFGLKVGQDAQSPTLGTIFGSGSGLQFPADADTGRQQEGLK